MNKSILYITNNILDTRLFKMCQKNIMETSCGFPIISVSQKPIEFGKNICIGELPHSSLSIAKQMLVGLDVIDTEFVAVAEHDCLYTSEHFSFFPHPTIASTFWYNENVWVLHVTEQFYGTFSTFPGRMANSQLICETELLRKATKDRIEIMSHPVWLERHPTGRIGEPGALDYNHAMRLSVGRALRGCREMIRKYINNYHGKLWKSVNPNIDFKHGANFTKNRRGLKRRMSIPFWGTVKDVMG